MLLVLALLAAAPAISTSSSVWSLSGISSPPNADDRTPDALGKTLREDFVRLRLPVKKVAVIHADPGSDACVLEVTWNPAGVTGPALEQVRYMLVDMIGRRLAQSPVTSVTSVDVVDAATHRHALFPPDTAMGVWWHQVKQAEIDATFGD